MKPLFYLKLRAILIPVMGMALLISGCYPKPVKRYPEVKKEVSPNLFDQAEQAFLAGNDDQETQYVFPPRQAGKCITTEVNPGFQPSVLAVFAEFPDQVTKCKR